MAHKITSAHDALTLMSEKSVTIDTLASAIVRGRGLSMTDNKREYLTEYVKISNKLNSDLELFFRKMILVQKFVDAGNRHANKRANKRAK